MKKILCITLVIAVVLSLSGCSSKKESKKELVVFTAASMKETLTVIGDEYMKSHDVDIIFSFDSSGTLKTQIQSGATCDIFISASPKQVNQLDINADPEINTEKLDYIDGSTRFNLLENKLVLAVPENNPKGISSYDGLVKLLNEGEVLLAIGNSDVPAGAYALKIFEYYNLDENELGQAGKLSYGSNVKEITAQVKAGSVDAGIIYESDAISAGLKAVDYATKEMCGQVIYVAAMIKESQNQDEAKVFLEYLKTPASSDIFRSVGLTPLN